MLQRRLAYALRDAQRMSRPARLDGCSYRGPYRYFLTICTRDRQQVFVQHDAATLVIDHLLENPVRAGLVQHPLDYPYSGSTVWTLEELIAGFV
jgi:hypothetical protein